MGINSIKYRASSAVKLVIAGLLILGAIILWGILALDIEDNNRIQARKNLAQILHCKKTLDPYMERSIIFKACADKMRTSFTGDVYILNPKNLEFIYESSKDSGKMPIYFTADSVGRYFNDWDSGEKALNKMLLGKDSDARTNMSYLFDNAPEWLEWKYTEDREGEMIIVQGTQSDEAMSKFNATMYVMFAGVFVLVCGIFINVGLNHRDIKV